MQVNLAIAGTIAPPNTLLTAGANTGLAAGNYGGTWAGVTGLVLPFG